MEKDDAFLAAMARMDQARDEAIKNAKPVELTGLAHEYIPGIHREPKAGAIHKAGSRREGPGYIFLNGKREKLAGYRRWGQR